MGTKCTRAYESIFKNFFEEKHIYPKMQHIFLFYGWHLYVIERYKRQIHGVYHKN